MTVNGAGPDGDRETQAALADVMGTLDEGALRAFHDDAGAHEGWLFFDCRMADSLPEPLKPADAAHPVLRRILSVMVQEGAPRAAYTLDDHLALFVEPGAERPGRIIAIPDRHILRALRDIIAPESVTGSELRLLKHLICGRSLAEAARADGVSHETRRSQYKSLSRKLAARSQNELANRVLTRLLADDNGAAPPPVDGADDDFIALMREFIPAARCFQLTSAGGVRHRFVDIGPVSGRPVALVHAQILSDARPADIALLEERDVRLIVPLRNGAMSRAARRLGVAAHLDHACEGIDLVRTHFAGDRLDIMACISGCAYGAEYARRNPDHVRSLVFIGACVRPATSRNVAGRLRSGLFSLAAVNWGLFSSALAFYGRRIRQPETFRRLMYEHYRPCPADLAIVEAEYASGHGGERGRKLFSSSMESMTHDFHHQMAPRWDRLPAGRFPVAFIHGGRDFIHSIGDVRALARSLGGLPVMEIEGAGQLLYHQHFPFVLDAWSDFLQRAACSGIEKPIRQVLP